MFYLLFKIKQTQFTNCSSETKHKSSITLGEKNEDRGKKKNVLTNNVLKMRITEFHLSVHARQTVFCMDRTVIYITKQTCNLEQTHTQSSEERRCDATRRPANERQEDGAIVARRSG